MATQVYPSVDSATDGGPSVLPGVDSSAPIGEALRHMQRTGSRHLVVMDRGRFAGLVSERELLSSLAFGADPTDHRVGMLSLMPAPVIQGRAGDPARAEDLARAMHALNSDVLVVCDGGMPVAVFTAMDVLALAFPAATAAGRRQRHR